MKTHQAKVINVVQAKTKYGLKLVLNAELLSDGSKVACWSNELGNKLYRSKHKGDTIELIESDKGKYSVLDKEPPHNIDGAGLKSVKEIMPNIPKSNGYADNGTTTQQTASSAVDDYLSNNLGLPELMSDAEKVRLSKLIRERAKLLTHTIEVMRDELNSKGLEFHEGSIRSLSVSLFIHISRFID
ncbi:MAG: hypothetical protein AAF316_10820 [Cyanobacteria bacterium P01_A01_bin.80]